MNDLAQLLVRIGLAVLAFLLVQWLLGLVIPFEFATILALIAGLFTFLKNPRL